MADPSILAPFLSTDPRYSGGFGANALARARERLSDSQIRSALSAAGLRIGSGAASSLGADTSLYQYRGDGGQFGAGSLANAQAAGMSNAEIRSSLAASGLQIGDSAAQALNVNPGKTFIGYSPNLKQTSYEGNSGAQYGLRPQLAPRGYGLDGRFSSDLGYSPTLYIAGGANDHNALNYVFGTDYDGGPNIGGGYYDPEFHQREFVPASSLMGGFGMDPAMAAFNAIMQRYNMDNATTNQAAAPAPQASFGSAGSTSNTARGVRTAGTPGSGTTYNTMNRAGSTGLSIGGLNMG